jgi:hypothetical protein
VRIAHQDAAIDGEDRVPQTGIVLAQQYRKNSEMLVIIMTMNINAFSTS